MHHVEAIGRNEMPFGKDACVVPSNIVLDRCPCIPMGRGYLGVETPQFAEMPPIVRALYSCFGVLLFSVRLISSVVLHVRLTCVY